MVTRYSHQFITGTDTGVGKTIVTGVLATEAAKAGQRVVVFKPIQTGSAELSLADDLLTLAKHFYAAGVSCHGPFQLASSLSGPPHRAAPTDRFNSCVGAVPCGGPPGSIVTVESLTVMPGTVTLANTYNFYPPVAPVVADVNGIIDIDLLVAQVDRLKTIADVVLVEGAGGVMVPLTPAADTIILMKQLSLPVILVARPDLGTINHTRLSVQALQNAGLNLHQVIISGYPYNSEDPAVQTLPAQLAQWLPADLLVRYLPYKEIT